MRTMTAQVDRRRSLGIDKVLAGAAARTRAVLEQRGFASAGVHHKWMANNSSPDEFRDYLETAGHLTYETILSPDPAALLFSEPGKYPFRSEFLRDKVATRARLFGSTSELFRDPERRHLVELTVAEQRFSKMLERANRADVENYSKFVALQEGAREKELVDLQPTIHDLLSALEPDATLAVLAPRLMRCALRTQCQGDYIENHPPQMGDEVGAVLLSGKPKIILQVVISPHAYAGEWCGSVGLKTYVADEPFGKRTPDTRLSLMFYFRALRDVMAPFEVFRSLPELALCCLAWSAAVSVMLEELRGNGLAAELAICRV